VSAPRFTPGPWLAWDCPGSGWQIGTKKQFDSGWKGHGNIGTTAWYQFPNENMNPEIEEANANLIAAAPEMYEACKQAYDWLGRFGEHAPITFGGEAELATILDNAIAKAEGKVG